MDDFWPFIFSLIEKLSILLLPDNDISGKLPWSVKKVINIEVPVFEHRVSVLFVCKFSTVINPIDESASRDSLILENEAVRLKKMKNTDDKWDKANWELINSNSRSKIWTNKE